MSEVEETLERIKNHKGVEGYVIADRNGNVLRRHPQMQLAEAEKYATYMKELTTKARGVVRDLNPKNDLQYMRIRIKKLELLIAHEKEFLVVVIQKWMSASA
uniref:Dynein light chain roadblock n=1 Tax=Globisporangium ultimum (strain ATCC 200006 / CBS 805.95 / DAOM BR144) TaxID=431595 RepID=K3WBK1_GLOUD